MAQIIELDCAPGNPRPGQLIGGVIKDTGLPERNPVSMFFGCWSWEYNDTPSDKWEAIKPILIKRITALYQSGVIRYGGWG